MIKAVAYTVRATPAQSERWRRAASAEEHRAVGTWLATAADAYLKARTRPIPLCWRRGPVSIVLDGRLVTVRGFLSFPFATHRGAPEDPTARAQTLIYLPTGRVLATLRYRRQAKDLAAELARTWVRWDGPGLEPAEDPAPIVQRHVRESV